MCGRCNRGIEGSLWKDVQVIGMILLVFADNRSPVRHAFGCRCGVVRQGSACCPFILDPVNGGPTVEVRIEAAGVTGGDPAQEGPALVLQRKSFKQYIPKDGPAPWRPGGFLDGGWQVHSLDCAALHHSC